MTTLIIPVMPNKEEAWRRFMQELLGSHEAEFRAWCRQIELEVQEVWLKESPGSAAVVVSVAAGNREAIVARLAEMHTPFERWLRQQILALHGMDVLKFAQTPDEWRTVFCSAEWIDSR